MIKMKSYGWGAHHEAPVCSGSVWELETSGNVVFSSFFTGKKALEDVGREGSGTEVFERGCNARGRLQVPRVPGHLELMAGGGDQTLNPRRHIAVEFLAIYTCSYEIHVKFT